MKKAIFVFLAVALLASISFAYDYPVRGYPTGEEVLNRKNVQIPQPDPELEYKDNGFARKLLSKVPPIGVHPRVVMSPEDIPTIRKNIKDNDVCKRAWDILLKKIKPDQPPKGHPWEGIYAMVTENDEYGKKAASALVEYSAKVDAKIDEIDATHPYSGNWWVAGIRGSGISNVAMGYDYLYNYMTDDQRDIVRKVISKGTVGRYQHGMEIPRSWRTWNWPHFSQNIVNTALAIEGEEGYEPRMLDICKESVVDFLTYKISPGGYDHESTGYNEGLVWGGGGIESLMAIARRLDPNPLTHPHLQNQADSFVGQQGGPNGPWFGRGDASGAAPGFPLVTVMRYFYPEDTRWDILWQSACHVTHWDGSEGRFRGVDNRTGDSLPFMLLYAIEPHKDKSGKAKNHWTTDNNLPLTNIFPEMGHMTTRSTWDTDNSVHLTFSAIAKMTNAGHDGPDEGTFSIWGHGVNWSRTPDKGTKYTPWRSSIAVDGKGQYYGAAHGLFLDVFDKPMATSATADVTYSYQWKLLNGRYNVLYSPIVKELPTHRTVALSKERPLKGLRNEEMDPTPFSREFWKFAGTNYGLWCGEDRHPTKRIPQTPMQRAFRSISLIRGKHPYVVVVDDIQQDDKQHLYDWIMPLAGHNEVIRKSGERDLRAVEVLVRRIQPKKKNEKNWPPALKKGDPVLLVRVLNRNYNSFPSIRFEEESKGRNQRIIIPSVSVAPDYKVLIYPHRHGDPMPVTKWNPAKTSLTVEIGNKQIDTFKFDSVHVDRTPFGGAGDQTLYNVYRDEKLIQSVSGKPSLPKFNEDSREFDGKLVCSFQDAAPGQEIRYTTNGKEPTAKSTVYTGPFDINATTTVKAATFASNFKFGPSQSDVAIAEYTKVAPMSPAVQVNDAVSGVAIKVYELPVTIWKGSRVDLESPLMPDLSKETPIFETLQKTLELPRVNPTVETEKMYKGFYKIDGYFMADTAGRYKFAMNSCGPTSLKVGSKSLIDVQGPYYTVLKERDGYVYLAKGLHRMEIIACDPAFFVSDKRQVVPFGVKVSGPGQNDLHPVATDQLYRERSLSFNIAANALVVGKPLAITSDIPGAKVKYTTNGKEPTGWSKTYSKPLKFKKAQNLTLKAALFKSGKAISPVIEKPLNVVANSPAIASLGSLEQGLIRSRYLSTIAQAQHAEVGSEHASATVTLSYVYPKNETPFNLKKASLQDRIAVEEFLKQSTGGALRIYEGYWRAPSEGVYEFNLPFNGVNQLLIDGTSVTSNHIPDAEPMGKIKLAAGWHKFTMMYEASKPGIKVNGPGINRSLTAADFWRDAKYDALAFNVDKAGKPDSFLLGSWLNTEGPDLNLRANAQRFGVTDDAAANASVLSGEKSLLLIKGLEQTAQALSISLWINADKLKGSQYLLNRQKSTNSPYVQRGGVFLRLNNDKLEFFGHGWNRPPKFGKLTAGKWHHIAATVFVEKDKGQSTFEVYLDGEKIHRNVDPHVMELACKYMEILAQAQRQLTEPETTAGLGYDELQIKNCFKGMASDVRLYDTILSPEAIKKLASKR